MPLSLGTYCIGCGQRKAQTATVCVFCGYGTALPRTTLNIPPPPPPKPPAPRQATGAPRPELLTTKIRDVKFSPPREPGECWVFVVNDYGFVKAQVTADEANVHVRMILGLEEAKP